MKVSKEILDLVPYQPGKPVAETQREYGLQHVIKLASNENPLGPSPLAVQALQNVLEEIHLYPDATHFELLQNLSHHLGVKANFITVGNGSNELIDLLIRIYCEPGDAILTPDKAFIAYQVCAQAARVTTLTAALASDFQTSLEAMAQTLRSSPQVKLVFIPNPNNPTGTYISHSALTHFLDEFRYRDDLLFIFDEAYVEFVRASDYGSALSKVSENSNVVVLRTFSKVYGLAGLRLGYMVASPSVIDLVNRVRLPFNLNLGAQAAGVAALNDTEFVAKTLKLTWAGLDFYEMELAKMGISYVPSQGNFVFFDAAVDSTLLFEACLKRGVILRPLKNYGLPTHLRMSVGRPIENEKAIEVLRQTLSLIKIGH